MGRIRLGLSSWTDKSLIASRRFYPAGLTDAAGRLRFYAAEFPDLVEVNSTYYGLPAERNSVLWAERTPAGFIFDVKILSLITQHPTPPRALPKDLLAALPAEEQAKKQLYFNHVPPEVAGEVVARFVSTLEPLRAAGKLGAILCQFPRWFRAGRSSQEHLLWCRERLGDLRMAVEFRSDDWLREDKAAGTLAFLKEHGLTYVCVDEPQGLGSSVPALVSVTTPWLSYVRFHGRRQEMWGKPGVTVPERTQYLYSPAELREWVPRIHELADSSEEVHVLMNTNFEDHAVVNARQLRMLLGL